MAKTVVIIHPPKMVFRSSRHVKWPGKVILRDEKYMLKNYHSETVEEAVNDLVSNLRYSGKVGSVVMIQGKTIEKIYKI